MSATYVILARFLMDGARVAVVDLNEERATAKINEIEEDLRTRARYKGNQNIHFDEARVLNGIKRQMNLLSLMHNTEDHERIFSMKKKELEGVREEFSDTCS